MKRNSVLVVTRNFPPLTGGMERLLLHTVEALAGSYDVTLIGPAGSRAHCPHAKRVIECPASPFLFLFVALIKGLPLCIRSRFTLVLGGSGLVAPVTAVLAKLCGASASILVHGLDLVVDSWIYQAFFVPLIRRHDIIIANSENTRALAVSKKCDAARLRILHPGSLLPAEGTLRDAHLVREKFEIGSGKLILFVGRIIKRKGLAPFLENAWRRVVESLPDAELLVVGDTPDDALMRDPDEAKRVESALKNREEGVVRFVGNVDDEMLWQCYAAADVLVFPLIPVDGDVEGFGMVAIEAAACGTPTVAFQVGGVADAVVDGANGQLVVPDDYEAFAGAVIDTLQSEQPTSAACRAHADNFSWKEHRRKLFAIIESSEQGAIQ